VCHSLSPIGGLVSKYLPTTNLQNAGIIAKSRKMRACQVLVEWVISSKYADARLQAVEIANPELGTIPAE